MPILSNFPGGTGSGGGGFTLASVTNIQTMAGSGKAYIKWTDPNDLVMDGTTLAAWGGTLLVRKAGSAPASRRDGTPIDFKVRNSHKDSYYVDEGLTNGTTYYYKLFPYTTGGTYTDSSDCEFSVTPVAIPLGDVSAMSAVAAGNGKLNVKYTDPDATVVQNGVTVATWEKTTVVVKAGGYATDPEDADAAFRQVVMTRNQYATTPLTVTGLTNGTTYYVSFFPISTDGAVNTNAANRTSGVPNRFKVAAVPAQDNSEGKALFYNGTATTAASAQTPNMNSDFDDDTMTLTVTPQTNAGNNYKATISLHEDYEWPNGSPDAVEITWVIGKADAALTVTPAEVILNSDHKSGSFVISGNYDSTYNGTLSIAKTSGENGVITYSGIDSNGSVTVNSVDDTTGEVVLTVSGEASANYNAPTAAAVTVKAQFLPEKKPLNEMTWADISTVSQAGVAHTYWQVGHRKAITINGKIGTDTINGTFYVYILSFSHNTLLEGTGTHFGGFKTALTDGKDVCLVDSKYNSNAGNTGSKYFAMNHWGGTSSPYNTNYGGWAGCDMRYDILGSTNKAPSGYGKTPTTSREGYDPEDYDLVNSPVANTLMAALPSDLRAVMQPMTKFTDNKGNSSNILDNVTATVDYLPLLAEFEVFGTRTNANVKEQEKQEQYAYYAASNPTIKYSHSATSTAAYWWERSPDCSSARPFCVVNYGGNAASSLSRYSCGLAPAFKV